MEDERQPPTLPPFHPSTPKTCKEVSETCPPCHTLEGWKDGKMEASTSNLPVFQSQMCQEVSETRLTANR